MSRVKSAHNTVSVLTEVMPYIKEFSGKTIVIKFGGHAMVSEELKTKFAQDVVLLSLVGVKVVVVHGGGPQIGDLLTRLNMESEFVDGMRVTDTATMNVVEMVLGSAVNKEIVKFICNSGGKAVGITGKDGNLISAKKISKKNIGKKIVDIGMVGEVKNIDTTLIHSLLDSGFTPVIAPIAMDESGETYNINADLVAGKMAEALQAEKLLLLSNVQGVLNANGKTIAKIKVSDIDKLKKQGVIYGGMMPKIDCACHAAKNNVKSVHIIDGREPHAILLEIYTDTGIGTLITD